MIDIETQVFNAVASKLRTDYSGIFITSEYVNTPPSFPCVSLLEVENEVYRETRTSSEIENHAMVMYEIQVFTNDTKGKKSKCRAIIAKADSVLKSLGFTRTLLQPIPNEDNATIYRMVGRYRAIVDSSETIYRR